MIDNAKLQPSVDAMFAFYRDRRLTWHFARQKLQIVFTRPGLPLGLIIDNRRGLF
jgi:hypothetical protein